MAQMGALVTEFAERHAGNVASMADSMQTQLRSRQGTVQSAFGELDAHRDSAVAELKVCDAPRPRLLTARAACSVKTPDTRIPPCSLAVVSSDLTIRRSSTATLGLAPDHATKSLCRREKPPRLRRPRMVSVHWRRPARC